MDALTLAVDTAGWLTIFGTGVLIMGALLLAAELYGVFDDRTGDTITEGVVWLRTNRPVVFWTIIVLCFGLIPFAVWLIYHFLTS